METELKLVSKSTPCNIIEIWQPRWRDKTVLIAKNKVGANNEIRFTKAKSLMNNTYYLSGDIIRACPTDTNGTIACYAVPMNELKILERV